MIHREASELTDTSMIFPELARPSVAPVLPPGLFKDLESCESLLAAQMQGHEIIGPGYHLDPPLAPPQASPQTPPQAPSQAPSQAATWAKIAARPEGNENEKAHTSRGDARSAGNAQAISESHMVPGTGESAASQQRVVFVKGCKAGTGLHDITKEIVQGPLLSISIGREPKQPGMLVTIIFFDAEHARTFLHKNKILTDRYGHGVYGAGVTVVPGPLWPEDDEIRAMVGDAHQRRERRRLVFSGAGLFHRIDGTTFQADLAAIAGDENIELIWLYNQGNATVVFASTRVARAVSTEFKRRALHGGMYEGVSITYATDPCEKGLTLATNIPGIAAVKMC